MEICNKSKITHSDLLAQPNTVLVLTEVEFYRDTPQEGHDILVGVCLPNADGPQLPRVATVEYHHGRKCWHIKVEYSRQQRNDLVPGELSMLIRQFETTYNVQLPLVKVRHLGVGIYAAQSRNAEENPWAFVDGSFYTVQDKSRGRRTFVADVRNGRTLISFITDEKSSESFEPAHVLSADDWKSLAPVL